MSWLADKYRQTFPETSQRDNNAFDNQLTEIALQRLTGEDRFAVLEAASRLRRYRELGAQVKATLDLL